jgi:hypothetical protein
MQGLVEDKVSAENAVKGLFAKRGCAAAIAALGWFGLGVQLYLDIEDALIKNLSVATPLGYYFSYFTIETNLLITVALTFTFARPQSERFLTRPDVKSALVVYIIIVGTVYEVLLRNLWHPQGLQFFADCALHDAIPFLYTLYWFAFLAKGSLRWGDPLWWLVYPVLYFIYIMLRGAAFGAYPYPFINAAQLGFMRVFLNGAGLLVAFLVLGVILTAIDHTLSSGSRARSGLGSAAET